MATLSIEDRKGVEMVAAEAQCDRRTVERFLRDPESVLRSTAENIRAACKRVGMRAPAATHVLTRGKR